ncbi:unnamed protein product [Musa textilis]
MALERHQSQGVESPSELACDRDVSWKDSGPSSMSAITFGLAATAVLVSMFLVMAIFEHLIIPRVSFFRPRSNARGSSETGQLPLQTHQQEKIQDSVAVGAQHTSDLSVLMPGQDYPTFIAQPAPLPCQREGIHWPSHVPHISYK